MSLLSLSYTFISLSSKFSSNILKFSRFLKEYPRYLKFSEFRLLSIKYSLRVNKLVLYFQHWNNKGSSIELSGHLLSFSEYNNSKFVNLLRYWILLENYTK